MNTIIYTIRLAVALRAHNLTHQIYDVMLAVFHLQEERGHATIPAVCIALSCTYQNVVQHLVINPDWFLCDETAKPRQYCLSPEALIILRKVEDHIKRPLVGTDSAA